MDPKSKRIVMANWVKKQPDIGDYSDEDIAAMTNKLQSLYPDAPKTSDYAPGALAGGITAGAQQVQQPQQAVQQPAQQQQVDTQRKQYTDPYMKVDRPMQNAADVVRAKYLSGDNDNAVASLADDLSRLPIPQLSLIHI